MSALGPIDVALLPIWGWGPSIGWGHLDPARAAAAVALIEPAAVIPIHWGTYSPEDGRLTLPTWLDAPADSFVSQLSAVGELRRSHLLHPGQMFQLGFGVTGDAARRHRPRRQR